MEQRAGEGRLVFSGKVLRVRVDPVTVASGLSSREVVERPPASAVLAEVDFDHIVMIKQFRWAVGETLWELPAGLVEPGEDFLRAAQRELAEETGYQARDWKSIASYYPSPGYSDERVEIFYARELVRGTPSPDLDEDLLVEIWDYGQVEKMMQAGAIRNGLTLVGLSWWLSASRSR